MSEEIDRLRRNITNINDFIINGFRLIRNNTPIQAQAGHFLIVMEAAIEEFENLCGVYEELTGCEHALWSKNGELFSDEWFELNKMFSPEDDE